MTTERPEAFDLASCFAHLGPGGSSRLLPHFSWTEECLAGYEEDTREEGSDGRLVSLLPHTSDWETWERHPAGDELVVALSGRIIVIHDRTEGEHRVELSAGRALVNPRGVWHTADVLEPGEALYITPGLGTEHRGRELRVDRQEAD